MVDKFDITAATESALVKLRNMSKEEFEQKLRSVGWKPYLGLEFCGVMIKEISNETEKPCCACNAKDE